MATAIRLVETLAPFLSPLLEVRDLLAQLVKQEAQLMSALTDFFDKVQKNFDGIKTDVAAVKDGVANLDALITQFIGAQGSLSAADQATANAIVQQSADIKASLEAINLTPPAPPAPTDPPTVV